MIYEEEYLRFRGSASYTSFVEFCNQFQVTTLKSLMNNRHIAISEMKLT